MTTVDEIQSRCALCGERNVHVVVLSTTTFMDTPDLDTSQSPGGIRHHCS
jgi:hypothetical protein